MTSPYQDLTCDDVLVLTDHGTHEGKTRVAVYRRADGTYLTILYAHNVDWYRRATPTLPQVESAADGGFVRPARGQEYVTAYRGRVSA